MFAVKCSPGPRKDNNMHYRSISFDSSDTLEPVLCPNWSHLQMQVMPIKPHNPENRWYHSKNSTAAFPCAYPSIAPGIMSSSSDKSQAEQIKKTAKEQKGISMSVTDDVTVMTWDPAPTFVAIRSIAHGDRCLLLRGRGNMMLSSQVAHRTRRL